MKIAHRFTVVLIVCLTAALSINAWSSLQSEIKDFEDEIFVHQSVIGRALRPGVMEVWRLDGEAGAMKIIEEADNNMKSVWIQWVWLVPSDKRWTAGLRLEQLGKVAAGEQLTAIDRSVLPAGRIYTYVPVQIAGKPPGAIEVSQSLEREGVLRSNELKRSAIWGILVAVISGLLTTLLGTWFIGRPMNRLVEQARRTGSGDLGFRIKPVSKDEVGELALEMNRMCDRLADAQGKISKETDEKLRALDQLRHADRLATVGRLAAGMAHELGTPLNVVGARAKSILRGTLSAEAIRDNGQIIVDQVDRMTRIMRQLLDFARKRELQKTGGDLQAIARRSLTFLNSISQKRNITLTLKSDTPLHAQLDSGQMEQVVTNLVLNAIHASPDNQQVVLEISERMGNAPDSSEPVKCACLTVTDFGCGIAQNDLTKVFEPFFTTKPIGEGTGLGLCVAYGIVKDHGGWIEVDSDTTGTRFTVWLPEPAAPQTEQS